MKLSGLLDADFALADLESESVGDVLDTVAELAERIGHGNKSVILGLLADREATHETSVGKGVAIPHAVVKGLSKPIIGVVTVRNPISSKLGPVRVFVTLLSPPGHESTHVRLLARIARLAMLGEFSLKLTGAKDGRELVDRIAEIDSAHP